MKTYLIVIKASDFVVATDEDEAIDIMMDRHRIEYIDIEEFHIEEYFDEEKAEEHRHGII